jgi:DNA polymerase III delta prime subunit
LGFCFDQLDDVEARAMFGGKTRRQAYDQMPRATVDRDAFFQSAVALRREILISTVGVLQPVRRGDPCQYGIKTSSSVFSLFMGRARLWGPPRQSETPTVELTNCLDQIEGTGHMNARTIVTLVQSFRRQYREVHNHRCPSLEVVTDPFLDEVEERDYKLEWSLAARFLLSHDPTMKPEEEHQILREFRRANTNLRDARLAILIRAGRVICTKGKKCEAGHRQYEEKHPGADLDREAHDLAKERDRLQARIVDYKDHGAHVAHLLETKGYMRLGSIFKEINAYSGAGTLIDRYSFPVLRHAYTDWQDAPSRDLLDAWARFSIKNAQSIDPETFNTLVEALARFWKIKANAGNSLGGPRLRNLVSFWAFVQNPKIYFLIQNNRVVKLLSPDQDLLADPFTATRYERILEEARKAKDLLRDLGPRDLLDLQTIAFICQNDSRAVSPFALGEIAWNCSGWTGPVPHPEDRNYQRAYAKKEDSYDCYNFKKVPGETLFHGFVFCRKLRDKLEDEGLIYLVSIAPHDGGEKGPWKKNRFYLIGVYGDVTSIDPPTPNPNNPKMTCNIKSSASLSTVLDSRAYLELEEGLATAFQKNRPDPRQSAILPLVRTDAHRILDTLIERHRILVPADENDRIRIAGVTETLERIRRHYFEGLNPMNSSHSEMDQAERALRRFGQAILYGPPGTGKTLQAVAIAKSLLQVTDAFPKTKLSSDPRCKLVVFHPSFEYEQFMRGLRPVVTNPGNGKGEAGIEFRTVEGIFLQMCWRALFLSYLDLKDNAGNNPHQDKCPHKIIDFEGHTACIADNQGNSKSKALCILVIDEINRGNVPALLGELVYGLEKDKRGKDPIDLPYAINEKATLDELLGIDPHVLAEVAGHVSLSSIDIDAFRREIQALRNRIRVPSNLLVIGTMNTSDRSIGAIDAAIRRRFPMVYVGPEETTGAEGSPWSGWGEAEVNGKTLKNELPAVLNRINKLFRKESDPEIRVGGLGHSYFLPQHDCNKNDHTGCGCIPRLAQQIRYFVVPLLREYAELGIGQNLESNVKTLVEEIDKDNNDQSIIQNFLDNSWEGAGKKSQLGKESSEQ